MTLGLVLLIVEVVAPAVRRLLKQWRGDANRRLRKPWAGLGRRPGGD